MLGRSNTEPPRLTHRRAPSHTEPRLPSLAIPTPPLGALKARSLRGSLPDPTHGAALSGAPEARKRAEAMCQARKWSQGMCHARKWSQGMCQARKWSQGMCQARKWSQGMCQAKQMVSRDVPGENMVFGDVPAHAAHHHGWVHGRMAGCVTAHMDACLSGQTDG
eukprot:118133-Chlamydomonas_euryale.AAC.2